ncbi:MAG: hypothetical protein ACQETB_12995 [Halobacteriota archaeon]
MSDKRTEACGRCSMTTVIDAAVDEDGRAERDPFGGARIEIDESEAKRVSPGAWFGGITTRLNELAVRITYGGNR